MKKTNQLKHTRESQKRSFVKRLLALGILLISYAVCAQGANQTNDNTTDSNESLLNQFVDAKGPGIIVFDPTNIKQFWTDYSVISRKEAFEVILSKKDSAFNESKPHKIQLCNVNESQDCRIEVIADTPDFDFTVLDKDEKVVSSSHTDENFLNYTVVSSTFHLENVSSLSFMLKFNAKTISNLLIKRIILSFSANNESSFLLSPGSINITKDSLTTKDCTVEEKDLNSFSATGKSCSIFSKKNILVSDKTITSSGTIKNIGDVPITVYVGYVPYTNNREVILRQHTPYNGINKILKVLSSEDKSNKIIVDSYSEWKKGCFLASNAKEDLSDFPNTSLIGKIEEVTQIDENRTEIILSEPVSKAIPQGTSVRIQTPMGATYIYMQTKKLAPGEEFAVNNTIRKDDNFFLQSNKALCHNTYYTVPVILSYPDEKGKDVSILVSKYTVSF